MVTNLGEMRECFRADAEEKLLSQFSNVLGMTIPNSSYYWTDTKVDDYDAENFKLMEKEHTQNMHR